MFIHRHYMTRNSQLSNFAHRAFLRRQVTVEVLLMIAGMMTPQYTRFSTASSKSGLCGALRLVESVQIGPGARLREAKCLLEEVRSVMVFDFYESVWS